MSQPHPRRRAENVLVIPTGLITRVVVIVAVLLLIGVLLASGAIARAASGTVVADRATVAQHQAAAERDIERGYEAATDQVRKARALKLAIGAQQADAIATKALADLATLRRSALISIGQTLGSTADAAETYARTTEQSLDAKRGQPQPSVAPVLLAPRLYAIVSRFDQLATQISDQATTDLTQSAAAPSATPTASGSPRASASPSPTR